MLDYYLDKEDVDIIIEALNNHILKFLLTNYNHYNDSTYLYFHKVSSIKEKIIKGGKYETKN